MEEVKNKEQVQKLLDSNSGKELEYSDLVKIINDQQQKINQLSAIDAKVRFLLEAMNIATKLPNNSTAISMLEVYNNELATILLPTPPENEENQVKV